MTRLSLRRAQSGLALLLALVLTACAAMRPAAPEVSLTGLQVTELSLSHAAMLAQLRLFNPNAFAVTVEKVDFTLDLNGIRVAGGTSASEVKIPAEETGDLSLRLSSALFNLLRLSGALGSDEEVDFYLKGKVKVGGMGVLSRTFPIERKGSISLQGVLSP